MFINDTSRLPESGRVCVMGFQVDPTLPKTYFSLSINAARAEVEPMNEPRNPAHVLGLGASIETLKGQVFAAYFAGSRERFGILVLRDITALRRLESIRREFVANVSHELRTPLASIKAVVETLEAGAIDDPSVAGDFLGRIVGEVDRLATLVDELLDLARLESGRTPTP